MSLEPRKDILNSAEAMLVRSQLKRIAAARRLMFPNFRVRDCKSLVGMRSASSAQSASIRRDHVQTAPSVEG